MRKKLIDRLETTFGQIPDEYYFDGDMQKIKSYHLFRIEKSKDFFVDDTTWNDLAMDDVYKRINRTYSTSGEQYLYAMLRHPAADTDDYAMRSNAIRFFEEHRDCRKQVQPILFRLGKSRNINAQQAFSPPAIHDKLPFVAILLTALLVGSIILFFIHPSMALPLIIFAILNPIYHAFATHRMESGLATVNYSVAMIVAAKRICKLKDHALENIVPALYDAEARTRNIARLGSVSFAMNGDLATFFNAFFHINLLTFDRLQKKLSTHSKDIATLHAQLGWLDASIAIASYRKSVRQHCVPSIHFDPSAPAALAIRALVHPLVRGAVPNDLDTAQSILLTGSNASGKSTYLKAVAINTILAQGICTALSDCYDGASFDIYTSMNISDNVQTGESYFIAEIKSIKRIFDAADGKRRVLCAIDEVLRGTNTIERIAASSELLRSLAEKHCICLAATHDVELCDMLSPQYRLFHFTEQVENGDVHFDYCLREGKATSRNAIKLLDALGFDKEVVSRAQERASQYEAAGQWNEEANYIDVRKWPAQPSDSGDTKSPQHMAGAYLYPIIHSPAKAAQGNSDAPKASILCRYSTYPFPGNK